MTTKIGWAALLLALSTGCGGDETNSALPPADPCAAITCSGHGTCQLEGESAQCVCEPGYEPSGLQCIDPNATVQTADQVVQYGVTWSFDQLYPVGQYANGDYWVVGPVTVTAIAPAFDGAHHGWEVNPSGSVAQGFDERVADFDTTRVPSLPFVAEAGESIVKAISLEPLTDTECRPCLQTAAVLTVVGEIPPDDGLTLFRPPYVATDKASYSTTALQLELLPSLELTESAPLPSDLAPGFARVQLDHKENWTGRAMHPADNLPDYGSSIAQRNAEGALALMVSASDEEKHQLLVHYVQYGIDLFHMMQQGTTWPPNGGHSEGRKLPICFAALLLGDEAMQTAVSSAGPEMFGETGGMRYSAEAGVVLWGQTPSSEEAYWTNVVFDTGSRTIPDPYAMVDGGYRPGDSYQFCCTSKPYKAAATALRLLPELVPVWNHQDFFDYVDRWVTLGAWAAPDPCAPPSGVCAGGDNAGASCTTASEPTVCTGTDAVCDVTVSWDAEYGVSYGPDGSGGCILDTDSSDGTGRFPARHATNADDGHYGSAFADEMWAAYVTVE
jgi:hypothetical protein